MDQRSKIPFAFSKMRAIFQSLWVHKLIGKPAFLTIADCESEARRIHLSTVVRHLEQGVSQPNCFILISSLNRFLNSLVLRPVYAVAKHTATCLRRRQFRAPHLFSFCHTIIVDLRYFMSYA